MIDYQYYRNQRLHNFRLIIPVIERSNALKVEEIEAGKQFRITAAHTTLQLDIYPMTKKYHNLTENKTGHYSNLTYFINRHFNPKSK